MSPNGCTVPQIFKSFKINPRPPKKALQETRNESGLALSEILGTYTVTFPSDGSGE
jgi:hypothetical protein